MDSGKGSPAFCLLYGQGHAGQLPSVAQKLLAKGCPPGGQLPPPLAAAALCAGRRLGTPPVRQSPTLAALCVKTSYCWIPVVRLADSCRRHLPPPLCAPAGVSAASCAAVAFRPNENRDGFPPSQ